jgi:Sec-independent protein translocase protein TatA
MLNSIEWLVVGLIGVAIIVWGPAKISDIAKAISKARKELNQVTHSVNELAAKDTNIKSKSSNNDLRILEAAKNLGISTAGKTREDLNQEIASKSTKS